MSLGGSKASTQTTVTDPLAAQKTAAANMALQGYQNIFPVAGQLQNTFAPRLGQSDFTSMTPQLLQDVYKAVQGDVEGTGGPFTSLKQNLLGNFDTGAQKFVLDPLKESLIKQGLYSSGPGYDVLGTQGQQLAQQRGLLGSQIDTQLLNMAQGLGSQQFDINQLLGFTQPIQALQEAQSIIQPPSFQDIATHSFDQPAQSSGIGGLLGTIAGAAIPALMSGGTSLIPSLGNQVSAYGGGVKPYTPPIDLTSFRPTGFVYPRSG